MTGYEETLLARGQVLSETGDLAETLGQVLEGLQGAGADPGAAVSLQAAIRALDADEDATYDPGSPDDRGPGSGYGSDAEFVEAVHDAETALRERLRDVQRLQEEIIVALDAAQMALEAALAMPVKEKCDGCHGAKAAAIADAERRIRLCDDATEITDPLALRLRQALGHLLQVPAQLGEVYELVYAFVSKGGKLPIRGRWIEGEGTRA
ncbi:MAG TPA: hypothetical protein VGS06_08495 [Streptosporangiaceae bacterium]|nr:hypothetical protein [Streptosporangiaceae bacterium]